MKSISLLAAVLALAATSLTGCASKGWCGAKKKSCAAASSCAASTCSSSTCSTTSACPTTCKPKKAN